MFFAGRITYIIYNIYIIYSIHIFIIYNVYNTLYINVICIIYLVYSIPSALEGHQWLTCSHRINSGEEPRCPFIKSWVGPRAIQDILEKRKILAPTRIQTLGHSTHGTDDILTKLHGSQNFNLQVAMRAQPWLLYPLERNTVPIVQEAGWARGPV